MKSFYHFLLQIFDENKTAVDCFLDDEYCYSRCHWCTGQTWLVLLRESIEYSNGIKKNQSNKFL